MSKESLTKISASLALIALEMQTLSKFLKTTVDTSSDFDNEMQKAITGNTATPPPVTSDEPVDDEGKGIPWTESIHAATKKFTGKGLWKRRQGVTVEEYDRVTAEIKAARAGASPAPAASPADFPPVPGAAATPPPPGVDSAPAPASAPVNEADKTGAMTAITLLTDEFGLTYESVLATMNDEFQVSSFDELSADRYPEANQFFSNWANEVRQCDEEIEKIVTIAGDNGQQGVDTIMGQNKVTSLETTPYNSLRPLHDSLIKYREQLDAWVASQN